MAVLANSTKVTLTPNRGAASIRPADAAGAAASAAAAAASAAAAAAVGTTNDTVIAGRVNDAASATAIALAKMHGTLVPVTRFGAKLDGTTDDTTAIQNAINSLSFTTANGDPGAAGLYFGPGTAIVTSLSVTRSMKWYAAGKRTTALKSKSGANADMIAVDVAVPMFELQDMTIDGNKANNTTGRGVVFLGDFAAPGVYRGSGCLTNVTVRNCAGHGIHAERWRSNGRLTNVTSGGNGGDGWRLDGFDWQSVMGDCGNNAGSGGRVSMGNLTVSGTQFYGNLNNIYIDTGCDRSVWRDIVSESSNADNVYINSTQQSRTHSFDGAFGVPLGATNLFSHFKIDSARVVNISGHIYDSTGATTPTVPKYIVDNTNSTTCQVEVGGLTWQNDDYGTAFAAVTNNLTMGGKGLSVKIPAHQLVPISGGCALTAVATNGVVLSMPAGVDSIASAFLSSEDLPRKWKNVDIYAHTVNLGSSTTGTYKLLLATFKHANGEDYTSVSATGSAQTITPSAQNLRNDKLLVSQEAAVDFTHDFEMKLTRLGATDGFANAVGIKCLEVRWRS